MNITIEQWFSLGSFSVYPNQRTCSNKLLNYLIENLVSVKQLESCMKQGSELLFSNLGYHWEWSRLEVNTTVKVLGSGDAVFILYGIVYVQYICHIGRSSWFTFSKY